MIQTDRQRRAMFARMNDSDFARQHTVGVDYIPGYEFDSKSGAYNIIQPMRYFYPEKAQMREFDAEMLDRYGRIGLAGRTPNYELVRREPVLTKEGLSEYETRYWDKLAIDLLEQFRIDPARITPLMIQAVSDGIREAYIKEFKEKFSDFEDEIGDVPFDIRRGREPRTIEETFKFDKYPEDTDAVLSELGLIKKLAHVPGYGPEPSVTFGPQISQDVIDAAYAKFYGKGEE